MKQTIMQSPKSIVQNWQKGTKSSLDCRVCKVFRDSTVGKCPSKYERTAYTVVAMLDVEWVIEAKVLGENFGAVDIYIPKYCLLIMVDGEGHIDKMYNLPSLAQEERDDRFNAEACRL